MRQNNEARIQAYRDELATLRAAADTGDIPVSVAKSIAETFNQLQVIVTAWDGTIEHVVTYGTSASDRDQAAQGGNTIKKALGWPCTHSVSPRVSALMAVCHMANDLGHMVDSLGPPACNGQWAEEFRDRTIVVIGAARCALDEALRSDPS